MSELVLLGVVVASLAGGAILRSSLSPVGRMGLTFAGGTLLIVLAWLGSSSATGPKILVSALAVTGILAEWRTLRRVPPEPPE